MPTRADDGELVSRILDGDHRAFGEFVYRYKGVVYGTLRRFRQLSKEDVDDLFQTVLLRLLENNQHALRVWARSSLPAYLKRIAQNIALDFLRRPQREMNDPNGEDHDESITQPIDNPGPDAEILLGELRRIMNEAIGRLSSDDQLIVRLLYFEQLNYSQIAVRLGITTNNAGVRIMRARDRLGEIIRNEFPVLLEYL